MVNFFNRKGNKDNEDHEHKETDEKEAGEEAGNDIDISEKIEDGWLLCRNIIEVLGKPKEHVEETLNKVLEVIESKQDYIIIKKDISEAKEQESMFSQFVEIEMLVRNVNKLVDFTFEFMPSSIEVLEPEHKTLTADQLGFLFNDVVGTVHQMDMIIKNNIQEKKLIIEKQKILLHNLVKVAIKAGADTPETISKVTGIAEESLKPILDKIEEEGVIIKKGGEDERAEKLD